MPIERLETVLDALPPEIWVDVELKAGGSYDQRLVSVVARCAARRQGRVIASSFDHHVLRELAQNDTSLPLLAICHARLLDPGRLLAAIPAQMICIDRPFLQEGDADAWKDEGVVLCVGGLGRPEEAAEVSAWPVAAIFLDDPRWARSDAVAARETGKVLF